MIGSIREVLSAADDWPKLLAWLSDPRVTVVTLTVTEKGYRLIPSSGRLRTDDVDIRLDLAGRDPRTVAGQLVRGLYQRRALGAGAINLVSCDNLPSNGRTLQAVVTDFVDALPASEADGLADWIAEHVAFPLTVVDRIVPATTPADREEVRARLGVDDHGVVVTEPMRTWVLENSFTARRPPWEEAGAIITDDVQPYELVKLRMLNGSHSALAYLGALADRATIADAIDDASLREVTDRLLRDEVAPTLRSPPDVDLNSYRSELLARYANRGLQHRTVQIAMDGTQKLPQRLLGTIGDRLDAGQPVPMLCLAVAAWIRFVWLRTSDAGAASSLDDPLADRLTQRLHGARQPVDAVDGILGLREVFPAALAHDEAFRSDLTAILTALAERGVPATVRDLLNVVDAG